MGFSNTSNLARVASYEDAEQHFNGTPCPRRGQWTEDLRPLGDNRQWHYRLEKTKDSYKVWLYHTCMAEYVKPTAEGRTIHYQWDNRPTSTSFMWSVVRTGGTQEHKTTEGTLVSVPLYAGKTRLHFDAARRLDLSRSDHTQLWRRQSGADDKARRAAFKRQYKTIVTLAALHGMNKAKPKERGKLYPTSGYAMKRAYGPFTSPNVGWEARHLLHDTLKCENELNESETAALLGAAELICEYAKGRAAYSGKPEPDLKKLETAIMRWLMGVAGIDEGTERVPLPKFQVVTTQGE